jgi:hypothetical protein
MSENVVVQVKKRPWYEWVLWILWVVILFFIVQNAVASGAELEPRAATIFWVTGIVWLIAGVLIWFARRRS